MAHTFELRVRVAVERTSGKFASKYDILQELIAEAENNQLYSLSGLGNDGDSEYEVTSWEVEEA